MLNAMPHDRGADIFSQLLSRKLGPVNTNNDNLVTVLPAKSAQLRDIMMAVLSANQMYKNLIKSIIASLCETFSLKREESLEG